MQCNCHAAVVGVLRDDSVERDLGDPERYEGLREERLAWRGRTGS